MSFLGGLFGGKQETREESGGYMIPRQMLASEFGKVNVRKNGAVYEIDFTILMEPSGSGSEGWQTGVALDASASMQGTFGRMLQGEASQQDVELYKKKGWVKMVQQDGRNYQAWDQRAVDDLIKRGVFRFTKNEMEPIARDMTAYLARNLDADGGTTVIYWACGEGSEIEVLGDFTAEQCAKAKFAGPEKVVFGNKTMLTPAVRYFADRFADANNGMYVFITDGALDDLESVKKYTTTLCKEIESKKRNPLKCVLIGLGEHIDEAQMEELDDLDSGTDVDIWDHKIAKSMRELKEIFAEVIDDQLVVATNAKIYDESGNLIKSLEELHAKEFFEMPVTSKLFVLDVAGNQIKQSIVVN